MIKYFYRHEVTGCLLAGICFFSPSLYGGEDWGKEREEIAQGDFHEHYPVRMGDWDYRENWQFHRKDFFRGETQPEAYRRHHPYGPGGIGYDADEDYLKLKREVQGLERNYNHSRNRAYER